MQLSQGKGEVDIRRGSTAAAEDAILYLFNPCLGRVGSASEKVTVHQRSTKNNRVTTVR